MPQGHVGASQGSPLPAETSNGDARVEPLGVGTADGYRAAKT
jgi:hypothetical protein